MSEHDFRSISTCIDVIWMYLDSDDPSVSEMVSHLRMLSKLNDEHLADFKDGY